MKKIRQGTAVLLASSILLTSCNFDGRSSSKSKKKTPGQAPTTEVVETQKDADPRPEVLSEETAEVLKSQEVETKVLEGSIATDSIQPEDTDMILPEETVAEIAEAMDEEVEKLAAQFPVAVPASTEYEISTKCAEGRGVGVTNGLLAFGEGMKIVFIDLPGWFLKSAIYNPYQLVMGTDEEKAIAMADQRAKGELVAKVGGAVGGAVMSPLDTAAKVGPATEKFLTTLRGKVDAFYAEIGDESIPMADRERLKCEVYWRAGTEAFLLLGTGGALGSAKAGKLTSNLNKNANKLLKSDTYRDFGKSMIAKMKKARASVANGAKNQVEKARYQFKLASMAFKGTKTASVLSKSAAQLRTAQYKLSQSMKGLAASIKTGSANTYKKAVAKTEDALVVSYVKLDDAAKATRNAVDDAILAGMEVQAKVNGKVVPVAKALGDDFKGLKGAVTIDVKPITGSNTSQYLAKQYKKMIQSFINLGQKTKNLVDISKAKLITMKKVMLEKIAKVKKSALRLFLKNSIVRIEKVRTRTVQPSKAAQADDYVVFLETGKYNKVLNHNITGLTDDLATDSAALIDDVSDALVSADELAKINKIADDGVKADMQAMMAKKLEGFKERIAAERAAKEAAEKAAKEAAEKAAELEAAKQAFMAERRRDVQLGLAKAKELADQKALPAPSRKGSLVESDPVLALEASKTQLAAGIARAKQAQVYDAALGADGVYSVAKGSTELTKTQARVLKLKEVSDKIASSVAGKAKKLAQSKLGRYGFATAVMTAGRARVNAANPEETIYLITVAELAELRYGDVVTDENGNLVKVSDIPAEAVAGLSEDDLIPYGFSVPNN